MAVLGVCDHHAPEERSERERQAGQRGEPGRADAQPEDREQKHLATAARIHEAEQLGHDEARHTHRAHHDEQCLADGDDDARRRDSRGARRPEQGHDEHHGHDAQVLEDQRTYDEATVWCIELATLGQGAQHDGGARKRERKAIEHAAAQRLTESQSDRHRDRDREPHLQRATERHLTKDVAQTR